MTQAYAISAEGKVQANTVSATARGALVNFLHFHVNPVPDSTPDAAIVQQFLRVRHNYPQLLLELVVVDLTVLSVADASTVALTVPPNEESKT